MVDRINPPPVNIPVVDKNGNASNELTSWFQVITDRAIIIGSGSPDGVIEAYQGAEYMDLNGVASAIKYIKQFSDVGGNKTLGWVLI